MVLSIQVYKKKIIRAFKFLGFRIEIFSNIKVANFLDVKLNLSDNSYRPFLKTDQHPSYININSNHPNSMIKQVTKAVHTRISRLSSNKKIFHESSKMYIEAHKNNGFKEEFTYLEPKVPNNINNNNKFPGDLGSIPGRVIPKTLKMELDTTLLNTQHYKVRFKGKVEQSREWSSALPYTLV